MGDSIGDNLMIGAGIALLFVPGGYQFAWLAHLAGSVLIAKGLEQDLEGTEEEGIEGALRNQNSNKAQIPVIYGTRRLGGTRAFVATRGSDNKFLDMILVVSEGPIKGFRNLYLDDAWCTFDDSVLSNTANTPKWVKSVRITKNTRHPEYEIWRPEYDIGDIVEHQGDLWTCQQNNTRTEEPGTDPAYWLELPYVDQVSDQTMLNSAGGSEVWHPEEYNRAYLDIDDTTGWDVDNYVYGNTSGATAKITDIDAGNDRLYIRYIQINASTNKTFAHTEVVAERTARTSGATGTTATGIAPMLNADPQYFKENVTYTVYGERMPTSTSKLKPLTREYRNLVTARFHNGSTTQTVDTVLDSNYVEWTSNHRLRGKAYIYLTFKFNKDRMTGIPTVTSIADGLEVYDPRDTLTKFESNPALCIRDYLTNEYYGRGINPASIDDASIIAAANYCDETISITDTEYVSTPTGTAHYDGDRYNTNARLDTSRTIFENIKSLLMPMRGQIVYTNGVYKLLADKETASYHTFDERNIIGGVAINLGAKSNTFNEFKVTYPNPLKNWESDSAVYFNDSIKTTLDNDLPLTKDVSVNTITNPHQALYIALQELKQSRQQISISFKTGIEGLLVEAGDVIRMRSLHYGWGTKTATVDGKTINVYNTRAAASVDYHDTYGSGVLLGDNADPMYKEFRVLSVSLDENLEVAIAALEYDPTVYTTMPATIEDNTPNTSMTDSRISLPPQNIVASEYLYVSKTTSGFKAGILLSWDTSTSAWDQSYEISVIEPLDAHVDGNSYAVGNVVYTGNGEFVWRNVTAVANDVSNIPGSSPTQQTTTIDLYYTVAHAGGVTDWSPLFGSIANPVTLGETYLAIASSGSIDTTLGATGALVQLTSWDLLADEEVFDSTTVAGVTEDRQYNIRDAKEGDYLIQIRSINVVGKRSDPAEIVFRVEGLSKPPAKPTGVGLVVSGDNGILTWDKATDLDVLISGSVRIKHNTLVDLSGQSSDEALEALWQNSTIITEGKSGATTQVYLPLIVGTYLIKFIDASGIESTSPAFVVNTIPPASSLTFVTSFSELTDFTTASFDGLTDDAETRAGFDTIGLEKITHDSVDKLQYDTVAGTFAAVPTVTSATYYLHNAIYFDKLVDADFNVDVLMETFDINNLVSSWADIDSLTSIDDPEISANVLTKIATTVDDPLDAGAAWSDYFTFLTGSIKCRGARIAIDFSVTSPNTQILIKDIIFSFSGKERSEIVNTLQWTTADYTVGYKDVWFVNPFFDGAGIIGADPIVPILNVTLNSSIAGVTSVVSNGTQDYINGPGVSGPSAHAGFRLMVSTFSALNTTTTLLNSNIDFGYQAVGY